MIIGILPELSGWYESWEDENYVEGFGNGLIMHMNVEFESYDIS